MLNYKDIDARPINYFCLICGVNKNYSLQAYCVEDARIYNIELVEEVKSFQEHVWVEGKHAHWRSVRNKDNG